MADLIVINTGPLIALADAEALDVVDALPYEFVCPTQVHEELASGQSAGHATVEAPWMEVRELSQPLRSIEVVSLDEGEAAVIQLAIEQNITRVCLDDLKARRAALAVGLKVTGTLGLLGRAKNLKLIPAMLPYVQRLMDAGNWYHPELVRQVLESVGEKWLE